MDLWDVYQFVSVDLKGNAKGKNKKGRTKSISAKGRDLKGKPGHFCKFTLLSSFTA